MLLVAMEKHTDFESFELSVSFLGDCKMKKARSVADHDSQFASSLSCSQRLTVCCAGLFSMTSSRALHRLFSR